MRIFLVVVFWLLSAVALALPGSFQEAKSMARQSVYFDRNTADLGTAYCGCKWEWAGRSGGRIDFGSCGFETRAQENRAKRIEWEHIVPAHSLGHQRQCWQNGGRGNCESNDPVFVRMHNDLHNLTPTVGEFNADRSNYRFSPLPGVQLKHGACPSKVDFKQRAAEPRDESKGMVARVYMNMHDRYDLPMSSSQQRLLMAWHKTFPVTAWERQRNDRIARIMGYSNPFVTGEKTWTLGHRNGGEGLADFKQVAAKAKPRGEQPGTGPIHGNKNSKIFHLPEGCPSYDAMAPHNRVLFETTSQAEAAGYRQARNCR